MTTTTRPRRSRRNGTSAFSEQEKRMRKREQNRVAQQTYRRAQKERIKALEAAVAKSADTCTWGTLGDDDVLGNEILVLDYSADPPTTTTTTTTTSTSPVTISTGSGSTHAAQTLCDPLLDDLGLALDLNHRLSDGHGGSHDVTDCLEDILSGFAFQGDNLDSLPGIGTAAASTPATAKNTTACFTPHHHHDYDKDKEHDQQKPTSSELVVHQQIGDVSIRHASSASISENAGDTAMSLPEIEGVRAWKYSPDEYKVPQDGSCSSDGASNCSCSGMCPVSIIRCATSGSHDGTTGSLQAATSRKHRRNKNTALHIAALASDSHMVQLLLERGADARLLNKDGQGPLHLAVMAAAEGERGHKDRQCKEDSGSPRAQDAERTIRLLLRALAAGTDPRRPGILDSLGRSLLFTAIATGSEAVVQMVLNAVGDESIAARTCGHSSSDPSTEDFEPDDVVRQAGIRALLEEPDAHGNFPLHIAAASGSTSMVMLLLSNGVDINQ